MTATGEKGLIALLICLPTALPAHTAVSASADFKRPTIPSEWLTINPKMSNPACALPADGEQGVNPSGYERIERVLRKTRWENPLFLKSGLEPYEEFLERQGIRPRAH